jgi:hypothetical protein
MTRSVLIAAVAALALGVAACGGGQTLNDASQCTDWIEKTDAQDAAYAKRVAGQLIQHPTRTAPDWVKEEIDSTCRAADVSHSPQSLGGLHNMLVRLTAERVDAEREARAAVARGETFACETVDPDGAILTGPFVEMTLRLDGRDAATCVTAKGEQGVVSFIEGVR